MGQALGRFGGVEWRNRHLKKISDKIFNNIKKPSQEKLSYDDLHEATLKVYNDINKYLPGPHLDPPTAERVKEFIDKRVHNLIKESDKNKDQGIDRDEFLDYIKSLTSGTFVSVWQRVPILTLMIAPILAVVTKKSTEAFPGVGKFVQKLPSSAYAFLVTIAALMFQNSQQQLLE